MFAKWIVDIVDVWQKGRSIIEVVGYNVHHYCLVFAKGVVDIVQFNVS